MIRSELVDATVRGAAYGAVVGGSVSAVQAGYQLYQGELSTEEAMVEIGKGVATGAVQGAVVNAGGTLIKNGLVAAGKNGLARGSAPIAIAAGVVESGKDVYRYFDGEIDGEELAASVGKTTLKTGAMWAGAEGGAALGSMVCPGVGTVVGGLIGGLLGGSLFS